MKKNKVIKLRAGLYIVNWKGGGHSLAAIGTTENGDHWIAPCNWICPATLSSIIEKAWKQVKSVILVMG